MAENWMHEQENIVLDFQEDGVPFTFTREIKKQYDPIEGEYIVPDDQETYEIQTYTSYGFQKATVYTNPKDNNDDGSIVGSDTITLMLDGSNTPEINDTTKINGTMFRVISVQAVAPGVVPLTYTVTIRP